MKQTSPSNITQANATQIYLDNAATSYPKPNCVCDAVVDFMQNNGASASRGAYKKGIESSQILYQTRKALGELVGARDAKRVIFTHSATYAINILLLGLLKRGDKVVTTSIEHNAILRPLSALAKRLELQIVKIPADENLELDLEFAKNALDGAQLLAFGLANNVTGRLAPLDILSTLARSQNVQILVDGAQGVGCVDCENLMSKIDFLAVSAHKALLAPMGVGALIFAPSVDVQNIASVINGGTGSYSQNELQPDFLPDKFESGTQNMHGIAGLNAALGWLKNFGISSIYAHENALRALLIESLQDCKKIRIYDGLLERHTGILSVSVENMDASDVGRILDAKYGVCVRTGLHCNPGTHKALGSFELGGLVRLSFGIFNTKDEILYAANALKEIASVKN